MGHGVTLPESSLGASLSFRDATPADSLMLLAWRNDAVTRANSFYPDVISLGAHEAWLAKRLSDPRCLLLIATDASGDPIGQVRFDLVSDGEAELTIGLAPVHRGRGYGTAVLSGACHEAFRRLELRRIKAYIKPANTGSIRIFERAGFGEWDRRMKHGEECLICCLSTSASRGVAGSGGRRDW